MRNRITCRLYPFSIVLYIMLLVLFSIGISGCTTASGDSSAWPEDAERQEPASSRDPSLPPVVTAVSPFENIGPNEDDNYIGFQISEFLSSGLASFNGVQVVERSRMQDIFEELNLQLSGLTDESTSREIGELLNAEQMVVGSFATTPAGINITGRIIEVETGEVLAGTSIESPRSESYTPAFRSFLFALISRLPEYNITIPVEARVDSVEQQSREEASDFARALEALFKQDDEKALEYLQQSVGTTQVGYVDYDEVSREYSQVLERLHGQSVFAQLIQNQIDHNQKLTEQLEPLGVYRSTLRVLSDRVTGLLVPENTEIKGDLPTTDDWELGDVYATVPLPEEVSLGLSAEAVGRVENFIAEQEIAGLTRRGLRLEDPPKGELLSRDVLERLFNLSWRAEIGYAVEFLDRQGAPVFRLDGAPVRFLEISDGERFGSVTVDAVFSLSENRDGWQINEDGNVEIQTRELRDVASMRLVLRPETFNVWSGFELYSNDAWQSLVTHAYRLKSVKTVPEEDTAPAFKEVMITDSWLYTGDPDLDPVPVQPREGALSAFADLTGVVYFADSASGGVSGAWEGRTGDNQGQINAEPQVISGDFGANTVLHFPLNQRPALQEGEVRFTAEYGVSSMSMEAEMERGSSWIEEENVLLGTTSSSVLFQEYRSYRNENENSIIYARNLVTGEELWRTDAPFPFGNMVSVAVKDRLLTFDSGGFSIVAIETAGGEELWRSEPSQSTTNYIIHDSENHRLDYGSVGVSPPVDGNRVYLWRYQNREREFAAIDLDTGRELWSSGNDARRMTVDSGRVFVTTPEGFFAYDAGSGKELWHIDEPLWVDYARGGRIFAQGIHMGIRSVLDGGIIAYNAQTGDREWRARGHTGRIVGTDRRHLYYVPESDGYDPERNYINLAALSLDTGNEVWQTEIDLSDLSARRVFVSDNGLLLYSSDGGKYDDIHSWQMIDPDNGTPKWSFSRDYTRRQRKPELSIVQKGGYFILKEDYLTQVLDLSVMPW